MNKIRLPSKLNVEIAYLAGFIMGDGHLCVRKEKYEYALICSGNLRDEAEFYNTTIKTLLIKLFKIEPKTRLDVQNNTIYLIVYSKGLVAFLSNTLKIPVGAKSEKVKIPKIFKTNQSLKRAFIQGFVDADFSLCLKRRYKETPYYPVISGTSKSKRIILEIAQFLTAANIPFSLHLNKKQVDARFKNKVAVTHNIYIYGTKNLSKWMETIGFRNSKYLKIVQKLIARGGVSLLRNGVQNNFEPPTSAAAAQTAATSSGVSGWKPPTL